MAGGKLQVQTKAPMELIDITGQIQQAISQTGVQSGICTIYNPHTTAGVTINEGADPDVATDLIGALRAMVPSDLPYRHGEGNSPSHVMATLTGSSATVIVREGKLLLGTWQRIFFCEFDGPRTRKIHWHILPEYTG